MLQNAQLLDKLTGLQSCRMLMSLKKSNGYQGPRMDNSSYKLILVLVHYVTSVYDTCIGKCVF